MTSLHKTVPSQQHNPSFLKRKISRSIIKMFRVISQKFMILNAAQCEVVSWKSTAEKIIVEALFKIRDLI